MSPQSEDFLRSAGRKAAFREPPAGFTDRVLSKLPGSRPAFFPRVVLPAALAAALVGVLILPVRKTAREAVPPASDWALLDNLDLLEDLEVLEQLEEGTL